MDGAAKCARHLAGERRSAALREQRSVAYQAKQDKLVNDRRKLGRYDTLLADLRWLAGRYERFEPRPGAPDPSYTWFGGGLTDEQWTQHVALWLEGD